MQIRPSRNLFWLLFIRGVSEVPALVFSPLQSPISDLRGSDLCQFPTSVIFSNEINTKNSLDTHTIDRHNRQYCEYYYRGDTMTYQKIAITVPPPFLKRLDGWVKKTGRSRSSFIVEELGKRLKMLEDEEITLLYNDACSNSETSAYDRNLAEEMLSISSISEEEEEW